MNVEEISSLQNEGEAKDTKTKTNAPISSCVNWYSLLFFYCIVFVFKFTAYWIESLRSFGPFVDGATIVASCFGFFTAITHRNFLIFISFTPIALIATLNIVLSTSVYPVFFTVCAMIYGISVYGISVFWLSIITQINTPFLKRMDLKEIKEERKKLDALRRQFEIEKKEAYENQAKIEDLAEKTMAYVDRLRTGYSRKTTTPIDLAFEHLGIHDSDSYETARGIYIKLVNIYHADRSSHLGTLSQRQKSLHLAYINHCWDLIKKSGRLSN